MICQTPNALVSAGFLEKFVAAIFASRNLGKKLLLLIGAAICTRFCVSFHAPSVQQCRLIKVYDRFKFVLATINSAWIGALKVCCVELRK